MTIECRRDLLRLDQVVGEETSQALVEGEINVPETKAPVAKILDISGEVVISSREVLQDKVMVEGILRYDVLYVPEDDAVIDSLDAEIGFTQYLELTGARPKMASQLKLNVEHIDFELNYRTSLTMNHPGSTISYTLLLPAIPPAFQMLIFPPM